MKDQIEKTDSDNVMQKVHKIQLELALEVRRICDKNGIGYALIAGTMLGAVRHKGFIPWDDDMDIGLLRPEFERFLKACESDLGREYFLQTWDTDPGFALPFAKIRKNGTLYIEHNAGKSDLHSGIYIDVFPYDNVPIGKFRKMHQNAMTYILKRILLLKKNYQVWEDGEKVKAFTYKTLAYLTKPFSANKIKNMLYCCITRYNSIESDTVVTFGGSYVYPKESIRKKWLVERADIQFEGHSFTAPKDAYGYLSYFYGDYMTPPPEEKRYNRHKIIKIDAGENIGKEN